MTRPGRSLLCAAGILLAASLAVQAQPAEPVPLPEERPAQSAAGETAGSELPAAEDERAVPEPEPRPSDGAAQTPPARPDDAEAERPEPASEDPAPEARAQEVADEAEPQLRLDPPLPVARPEFPEALRDARRDDAPEPSPGPVADEAPAVLPDGPREPLAASDEERRRHQACLKRLDGLAVEYESLPAIDGQGDCGAAFPLRVTRLAGGVRLSPAPTVVCPVAEALARWNEEALKPAASEHLSADVETIYTAGSYECRGRNRRSGAKLSEHAYANALDITGVDFADRKPMPIEPRKGDGTPEEQFQREVRKRACAIFTTVLGPGADAAHADHLHVDLRQRKNDYRLCQ
jgi:hypothetical protein